MSDKYVFFWGGPFSQWAQSLFEIRGKWFTSCEQWMMYNKALMFEDHQSVVKIMATANPKEQKAIGRQVIGYDDEQWMEKAFDIVVAGNRAKFSQNIDMFNELSRTKGKIIVEASPYDRRWGIGLAENAPGIEDESNWKGENLLGKAIMKVRDELCGT